MNLGGLCRVRKTTGSENTYKKQWKNEHWKSSSENTLSKILGVIENEEAT